MNEYHYTGHNNQVGFGTLSVPAGCNESKPELNQAVPAAVSRLEKVVDELGDSLGRLCLRLDSVSTRLPECAKELPPEPPVYYSLEGRIQDIVRRLNALNVMTNVSISHLCI